MPLTDGTRGRCAPRRTLAIASLLILALVLVACAGSGAGLAQGEGDGEIPAPVAGAPDEAGADLDAEERGTGPSTTGSGAAAPIQQRIIKTGEVTLEVENVGTALGRVRAMATELGGYVGGSQAGTLDDRATLTLRIPADRFDDALARLHEMDATLVAEATREEDVTGQVVDLEARIGNLQASEATYRQLVERAEKIDDILAVQSRLDQVRGEIEQLEAQLQALAGRADLSTLTVTLVPRPEPVHQQTAAWDPGGQLDRAVASLVGIGQGLLDGLIWFVVVWLPVLLALGLMVLLALRGVLEVRRRLPASTAGEPPGQR